MIFFNNTMRKHLYCEAELTGIHDYIVCKWRKHTEEMAIVFSLPYYVFILAILLPNIAVGIRRLHDIDKSGWWLLVGLIPLVGAI